MLIAMRPFLRYSSGRDAYVVRIFGNRFGPVMRPDRRRGRRVAFEGIDRRGRGGAQTA
jgi:hypothetical protein